MVRLLMSPPEPSIATSFVPSPTMTTTKNPSMNPRMLHEQQLPMSPPISPLCPTTSPDDDDDDDDDSRPAASPDPILFPAHDPPDLQSPLFDDDHGTTQKVVDDHMAARRTHPLFPPSSSSSSSSSSPPKHSEYRMVLEFKSQVARRFNADRPAWLQRERAYLVADRRLQSGGRRYTHIAPAPRRLSSSKFGSAALTKTTRPPRVVKTPRETTPDAKKVARDDRDFALLVDYSPPPHTHLPSRPNPLKVDWKGAPIDLDHDPHRDLLHPDELALAANLRLDCATYLTSKRRMFVRRLECYQQRPRKEFRKTDAQQACRIDVNKASKLWQAFDKVGWLDESWIRQFAT